ncbi:MAG: DUF711 family protein, partial [Chloroflexi bacterium]|nr:DUF711 family protein [Chloroflexota bacterium]
MNIRSLTGFLSVTDPFTENSLRALGELVRTARVIFSDAELPLQTARVATQSISEISPRDLSAFARTLEAACQTHAIDYAALGALQADANNAPLALVDAIPDAIRATKNIFASVQIATRARGINLAAIQSTARVIHTLANTTPEGFGNFRFAALANCAPHAPFFPVAYQRGTANAFALAVETAPLAVDAFTRAQNLAEARAFFIAAIEAAAQKIAPLANDLTARFAFQFLGMDFSTAPFPETEKSIGTAM